MALKTSDRLHAAIQTGAWSTAQELLASFRLEVEASWHAAATEQERHDISHNVTGFLPEPSRPSLVAFGPTVTQYAAIIAARRRRLSAASEIRRDRLIYDVPSKSFFLQSAAYSLARKLL